MYNNKRLALSIFWLVTGMVLIGLSLAGILDSAIYSGFGGGLIGVGALRVLRSIRFRRDPEYREKVETAEKDERLRFIRMKSWSWVGYIVILTQSVAVIVALVLRQHAIVTILSYSVCFILISYWLVFLVLSKKY